VRHRAHARQQRNTSVSLACVLPIFASPAPAALRPRGEAPRTRRVSACPPSDMSISAASRRLLWLPLSSSASSPGRGAAATPPPMARMRRTGRRTRWRRPCRTRRSRW
jgi:hypothetical protein